MKVLSAYDLSTGHSVFWDGSQWAVSLQTALVAVNESEEAALNDVAAQQSAANQVLGAYLVAVTRQGDALVPRLMRERRRVEGPSIAVGAEAFERLKAEYGE